MVAEAGPLLAGDIGGTKTRLALFQGNDGHFECLVEREYASREHAALDDLLTDFTGHAGAAPVAACFGVAGPVRNGRVAVTNLPWEIRLADLERRLQHNRVALLNDLEATAWSLEILDDDDFHTLNPGRTDPHGNAALIAAGTGLGEAGLCRDAAGLRPFATEGGHADFSPGDATEIELLEYLLSQYRHVSWERVVSGPGLVQIHAFLASTRQQRIPDWLKKEPASGDPAAAIAARASDDPLCGAALRLFVRLYGREAGNLALKTLATGGCFLGGGIAPKILDWLEGGDFLEAFCAKGRMQPLLEGIPVRVIRNDRAALIGAARYAAMLTAAD